MNMFNPNLESPFKSASKNTYNFQFVKTSFEEEVNKKETKPIQKETQENSNLTQKGQIFKELNYLLKEVREWLEEIGHELLNYINFLPKELSPNYKIDYVNLYYKKNLIHYSIVFLFLLIFTKRSIIFMEFVIFAVVLAMVYLNRIYIIVKLTINGINLINFEYYEELDKFHLFLFLLTIKPLFILYPLFIIIDKNSNVGSLLLISAIIYSDFLYVVHINRFHEKLNKYFSNKIAMFRNKEYFFIFITVFFIYFIMTYAIIIK